MALDLWQIRRQKRMTIDELSRQAEIHPGLIKAYELGERAIADQDLERLAEALEVEPWEIKQMSDPPPRGPSREAPPPSQAYDSGQQRYDNFNRYERGAGYTPRYNDYSSRPGYSSDQPRQNYSNDYDRQSGYTPRRSGDYQQRSGDYQQRSGDYQQRSGDYQQRSGNYQQRSGDYQQRSGDYQQRDSGAGRPPARPRTDRPVKKPGGPKRRPQIAPARPSQLEHLKTLLVRLDMSGDELLRLAGKPLSMLNRKEAAELLTTCQTMLTERKPEKPKGKRQRPYLPESVDEHELLYLTRVQLEQRPLDLTLFNGERVSGDLVGFSPYALTLAGADGQETTVQKLAIAYYQTQAAAPQPAAPVEESESA